MEVKNGKLGDPLAPDILQGIAEIIAQRLMRDVEGNINRPTAWRRLAKKMGIEAHEYNAPGKTRGHCMPALIDETLMIGGTVSVNLAYPKAEQARVWVHELAHLCLLAMTPHLIDWYADSLHYDGNADKEEIGHDIARRVERIIL